MRFIGSLTYVLARCVKCKFRLLDQVAEVALKVQVLNCTALQALLLLSVLQSCLWFEAEENHESLIWAQEPKTI